MIKIKIFFKDMKTHNLCDTPLKLRPVCLFAGYNRNPEIRNIPTQMPLELYVYDDVIRANKGISFKASHSIALK